MIDPGSMLRGHAALADKMCAGHVRICDVNITWPSSLLEATMSDVDPGLDEASSDLAVTSSAMESVKSRKR